MLTRLYLRIYLAALAGLVVFAFAVSLAWNKVGDSSNHWQSTEMLMQFAQNILPPITASAAEQQQALERISHGMTMDLALYDAELKPLASAGDPLPLPDTSRVRSVFKTRLHGPPLWTIHLPDGRWLMAQPDLPERRRRPLGGMAFAGALLALLLVVGIAAYPIARRLTRRLEHLQQGVESLGRGDLSARVDVQGRDEVARLAQSFNRAADRIEELVGAHRLLLANASHELRTPLTRIRMAIELMKSDADPARKTALEQDIAELDRLIADILLTSRLDALSEPAAPEEIDLLALAAEECARYADVDVSGDAVSVRGDAALLRRLIRNLVENALSHGKPPVAVSTSKADGYALLRVSDGGPGVAANQTEAMFEPFYRIPGTPAGGTGLGLALVRKIAKHHGGDAVIERNGPNGLTVLVKLRG